MADVVAGGVNMVLARYSDVWRVLRKNAHTMLTPKASLELLPIQRAEATQLMYDILQAPDVRLLVSLCGPSHQSRMALYQAFYIRVRRYSSFVILSITYGKRCSRYESPEVTLFLRHSIYGNSCWNPERILL